MNLYKLDDKCDTNKIHFYEFNCIINIIREKKTLSKMASKIHEMFTQIYIAFNLIDLTKWYKGRKKNFNESFYVIK